MPQRRLRSLSIILLVTLLASQIPPLPAPPEAHAQGQLANAVVGFFKVLGAFRRRNRVYREARATQGEMNAYYDELTSAAQGQLTERELMGTGRLNAENRSQLRVYMRLRAALLAEQQAVTDQIEAEKNQARQEFNRRLANELVQVLIRSPGGQSLLNDIRRGMDELRQAAQAVQTAIGEKRPFEALAQAFEDKAGDIPLLRDAAYNLGQHAGHKFDELLGGVISDVDRAMANVQAGMGDALAEINRVDAELARFDETERQPVSLVEEGGPLGQIYGVDRANAPADVAAQAYTNAAIIADALRNPSEAEKETMRDRIRSQLLADRLDRLDRASQLSTHVNCRGVGRGEYIQAMGQLGRAPEDPMDPDSAGYLVCRDTASGEIVHAALIGGSVAEATEVAEEMATEEDQTEVPTEPPLLEDRCSLSGEGDFVIENVSLISTSSTCDDDAYPADSEAEIMLLIMASTGIWSIVEETPVQTTWGWRATQDLEGAIMQGTAIDNGSTLDIDVSMTVPPSGASYLPPSVNGNGLALLGLLPMFPLALTIKSRRRRRWALLTIAFLSLLLTAQSCDVYGTLTGSYSFPLPPDGFPCEVPAENPNLAEMPGSSGQSAFQLTIDSYDEEGQRTASETCEITAHMTGTGILKREGVYTQADLE